MVVYDQSIGTPSSGLREARALERSAKAKAVPIHDGPLPLGPVNRLLRPLEMAFGIGLTGNVKQLYRALAERYDRGDTADFDGDASPWIPSAR